MKGGRDGTVFAYLSGMAKHVVYTLMVFLNILVARGEDIPCYSEREVGLEEVNKLFAEKPGPRVLQIDSNTLWVWPVFPSPTANRQDLWDDPSIKKIRVRDEMYDGGLPLPSGGIVVELKGDSSKPGNTIRIYDSAGNEKNDVLVKEGISNFKILASGEIAIQLKSLNMIRVYSEDGDQLYEVAAPIASVHYSWGPTAWNGLKIISGINNEKLELYDSNGKKINEITEPGGFFSFLDVETSPSGEVAALLDAARVIRIYDKIGKYKSEFVTRSAISVYSMGHLLRFESEKKGSYKVITLGCEEETRFAPRIPEYLKNRVAQIKTTDKIETSTYQRLSELDLKKGSWNDLDKLEDQLRLNDGSFQLIKPEAVSENKKLPTLLKFELINTPSYKKLQDLIAKEILEKIINRLTQGEILRDILIQELDQNAAPELLKKQREEIVKMFKAVFLRVRQDPETGDRQMSLARAVKEALLFKDYQDDLIKSEQKALKEKQLSDETKKLDVDLRNLLLDLEPKSDLPEVSTNKEKQVRSNDVVPTQKSQGTNAESTK